MKTWYFIRGSHTGIGKEAGIRNVIAGLDQAITGDEKIYVLLETMTGKGTEIGDRFEELKAIREGAAIRSGLVSAWIPVMCLRQAMILYMIWMEYCRNSMTYWDLSILKAIHLNDSMMPFGSHKDRHAVLGEGEIGMDALLAWYVIQCFQSCRFIWRLLWMTKVMRRR